MKYSLSRFASLAVGLLLVVTPLSASALTGEELQQQAQSITVLVDGLNPGSGVIVARDVRNQRYWVLTAQHVVATQDEYWVVTPDGQAHPLDYRNVYRLPGDDLALIAFESSGEYPIATLTESLPSRSFPYVFVSGWVGSQIQSTSLVHKFSAGQLLPRRYGLLYARSPLAYGYGLFYTSITETGMSGGPILDTQGRVIGIHGRSEGQEYYLPVQGEAPRSYWGFSSGIPLPSPEDVGSLVGQSLNLRWEQTPLPALSPAEATSIQAMLAPSEASPMDAIGWNNRGNQLYRLEKFDDAIAAFQRAIQYQPDFYPAWYGAAQTLTTLGRYPEAIRAYNRVIEVEPDFYQVLRDRALVWVLMGEYQQAATDFEQSLRNTPEDYVTWYLQGNLLWRHLNRPTAALNSYEQALAIAPEFAEVWVERGRVLRTLGYSDQAIASVARAVELEPQLAMGWHWLAVMHRENNEPTAALAAISQATQLRAGNVESLLLKSQLLVETGQIQAAESVLAEILRLQPRHQQAQQLLQQISGSPGDSFFRRW